MANPFEVTFFVLAGERYEDGGWRGEREINNYTLA